MATNPAPVIVRVSGYVGRSFDAVVRDLDGPQGRQTFSRAFAEATGNVVELTSRREPAVSRGVARYRVGYRVEDREGEATVIALEVQRGRDPITEVLAHVEIGDPERATDPRVVAATLRHSIDVLSDDLMAHAS